MKITDLVFIGIKGSVVALNRSTGQQVWVTHLAGYDFVSMVLDNGTIIASCQGEVFCLDPLTGNGIWHNPLKGFGYGLSSIVTANSPENNAAILAETQRQNEESASQTNT